MSNKSVDSNALKKSNLKRRSIKLHYIYNFINLLHSQKDPGTYASLILYD